MIFVVLCTIALGVSAQNFGIGLRAGEPSGFSFKKYLPAQRAFELTVGSTGYIYNTSSSRGVYRSGGLSVMGNYLFHRDVPGVSGLEWYYGLGASMKIRSFRYYPQYVETASNVNKFSFSPNGVAGLEYTIRQVPISIFLDVMPYVEIAPYPGVIGIDGGLGARYNF